MPADPFRVGSRAPAATLGVSALAIVVVGLLVEWPADQSTSTRMEAVRATRSVVAHWLEAVASAGLAGAALVASVRLRGGGRTTRSAYAALALYGLVLAPLAVLLASAAPRMARAGDVGSFETLMRGIEAAYAAATVPFLAAVALLARARASSSSGIARALAYGVLVVAAVAAVGVVAAVVGVDALAPLGFFSLVAFLWLGGSALRSAIAPG